MLISVIVPAYNEAKYIGKTLKALNNQSINRSEYEIIVCNDSSTDKTAEVALKYADTVLNFQKCKTIGEVRNKGAEKASGKILLFVDADTIVPKKLLTEIKQNLKDETYYAAPKVFFSNNPIIKAAYKLNYFLLKNFPELGFLSGCCMAIHKRAFRKVRGFNEKLTMNEERDISCKLLESGYKLKILNSTVKTSDRKLKGLGFEKLVKIHVFDALFKAPQKIEYTNIR